MKSLYDKDIQITALMHKSELHNQLAEDNPENAGSSITMDPTTQEHL